MHVPHRSSADLTGGAGRVATVSRLQGLAFVAFLANALDVQHLPALLAAAENAGPTTSLE